MSSRQRATIAICAAAILWFGGSYALGATIGIEIGAGMRLGVEGGLIVMGISAAVVAAYILIGFLMWLVAEWIERGRNV